MSKNFELLRKAGKWEIFLEQGNRYSPIINEPAVDIRETPLHDDASKTENLTGSVSGIARDQLVKLVRTAFVLPNSHAPRIVCFSSIERGGSTQVCLRAAQTLAEQGVGSVCLVDANLHASSLHLLLGIRGARGLTDGAVEKSPMKDYAVLTGQKNLWFIPQGTNGDPDVQRLLVSDRYRTCMAELKDQFDYVLIDGPSLTIDGETVLLGQMTDGLILVLEANSTRRETVRIVKESLEKAKVKIIGAILNNRRFPIPDALYRKL